MGDSPYSWTPVSQLESLEVHRLLAEVYVVVLDRAVRIGDRHPPPVLSCGPNERLDVSVVNVDTALPPEEFAPDWSQVRHAVRTAFVGAPVGRVGDSRRVVGVDPRLVVLVARRIAREVLLRARVLPSVNGLVHAPGFLFDYAQKRLKANVNGAAVDCGVGSHLAYYPTEEATVKVASSAPELSLREDSNLRLILMRDLANHRLRALLTAMELSQGLPSYPIAGLAYSLIRGAARTLIYKQYGSIHALPASCSRSHLMVTGLSVYSITAGPTKRFVRESNPCLLFDRQTW